MELLYLWLAPYAHRHMHRCESKYYQKWRIIRNWSEYNISCTEIYQRLAVKGKETTSMSKRLKFIKLYPQNLYTTCRGLWAWLNTPELYLTKQ